MQLSGEIGEEQGSGAKRCPGRPRSEQARRAILRSTLKLLKQVGFASLSIESIAAAADVGKATVYRWWPTKATLVADAFFCSADRELRFPNTNSVRLDMSLQMKQVVKILRGPRGRVVAALIGGGQSDPELIDCFRKQFLRPRRQEAYVTLRRGIDRGELPRDLDMDLMLDSLYGPLYFRFLIRHDSLTEEFVDQICGAVMEGLAGRGRRVKSTGSRRRESRL